MLTCEMSKTMYFDEDISNSESAQKIIIRFLSNENVVPNEIFTRLKAQFGTKCLAKQVVTELSQLCNKNANNLIKKIDLSKEHGYAKAKTSKQICYTKKFREIRPAPSDNLPNKKFSPKKIIFSRKICTPIKVVVSQSNLIQFEENLNADVKPEENQISIPRVEFFNPNITERENLENEIPQGVDREIIIETCSKIEGDFGENCVNYMPLVEHRYAISNSDLDKNYEKNHQKRQGKALTSDQKISAYEIYLDEKINKKCSKSQSVTNAAKAMGISTGTMWNLVKEMEKNGEFLPPRKRRKRSNFYEILDENCKDRLLSVVKQLLRDEQVPTVDQIYMTLREDDNFPPMSRTTVYNQLKRLGFKYEKRGKEKILKEKRLHNATHPNVV